MPKDNYSSFLDSSLSDDSDSSDLYPGPTSKIYRDSAHKSVQLKESKTGKVREYIVGSSFDSSPTVKTAKISAQQASSSYPGSNAFKIEKKPQGLPPFLKNSKPCNCTQSQCLKQYCVCFSRKQMCDHYCNCKNCCNNQEFESERNTAIDLCLEKNPGAFKPKMKTFKSTIEHAKSFGCQCKKSSCMKRYCKCYGVNKKCGEMCRCVSCQNMEDKVGLRHKMNIPKLEPVFSMQPPSIPAPPNKIYPIKEVKPTLPLVKKLVQTKTNSPKSFQKYFLTSDQNPSYLTRGIISEPILTNIFESLVGKADAAVKVGFADEVVTNVIANQADLFLKILFDSSYEAQKEVQSEALTSTIKVLKVKS